MDVKELSREESLKYYENEKYSEEINKQYEKISLNLSMYKNITNVSKLGSVHTLDLCSWKNVIQKKQVTHQIY